MTVTLEIDPQVEEIARETAQAQGIALEDYLPVLLAQAVQEDRWQENSLGRLTMLAAEPVLSRLWDTPEEDAAWAYLSEV